MRSLVVSSSLEEDLKLSKSLADSGYFNERTAGQALAKILAGRELGLGPVASLTHIIIGKGGRIAFSAAFQSARLKAHPHYGYKVVKLDDTRCEIVFTERGQEVGRSVYTIEEARRAKLTDKDVWKFYPSDLLFARAITRGIRRFAPDILMGAYSAEEIGEREPAPLRVIEAEIVESQPRQQESLPAAPLAAQATPIREMIAAPQAAVPVPPATSANGATQEQLAEIRRLKVELDIPDDSWKSILSKRGVASARDLPTEDAAKLVMSLGHRVTIRQLEEGFQNPTKGGEADAESKSQVDAVEI